MIFFICVKKIEIFIWKIMRDGFLVEKRIVTKEAHFDRPVSSNRKK